MDYDSPDEIYDKNAQIGFYNFPSDRDDINEIFDSTTCYSYLPSRRDDKEYEERHMVEDEELFEEFLKYLPIDGLDSK